jgi:hypothetical protein
VSGKNDSETRETFGKSGKETMPGYTEKGIVPTDRNAIRIQKNRKEEPPSCRD